MDATNQHHVIAGAGPVGSGLALSLASMGHRVSVVTRSGAAPVGANITAVRGDVGDAAWFTSVVAGAATVTNAVNPPYGSWDRDWPPLHRSLMAAAQSSGAVLVSMENLYAYGSPAHAGGVMREDDPFLAASVKGKVRAQMSNEIFAAHAAGDIRAVSIRASDFFGPGVTDAAIGERGIKQLLVGKKVQLIGNADVPHSVSYMPDVVRALTIAATDSRTWGRAWHVPSAPAVTQREMWGMLATAAGLGEPKLQMLSGVGRRMIGLVMPIMRQIEEVAYQFDEPFVMDSSPFTEAFGMQATTLRQSTADTMAWWQQQGRVSKAA
jgi:nucleoside-diphosphate-sugar epimerase